jgi:hypothetical protein
VDLRAEIKRELIKQLPHMGSGSPLHQDILKYGAEVAIERAVDECEKQIVGIRALTGEFRR